MSTNIIANKINELLPDTNDNINDGLKSTRQQAVKEKAEDIIRANTAKELTKIKQREKAKLAYEQEKLQKRQELGIEPGRTLHQQKEIEEQEAIVAAVESLEEQNKSRLPDLIKANIGNKINPNQAAIIQTTTRRDVTKLLTSLNINLNLQLTKNDTYNLLACLLTCNETQLNALYNNKKIPVAIKTVIRRLLEDARLGNMETVEALWDRIFGKNGMPQEIQQQATQNSGVIPGTPISREAYIILRDTLIK